MHIFEIPLHKLSHDTNIAKYYTLLNLQFYAKVNYIDYLTEP